MFLLQEFHFESHYFCLLEDYLSQFLFLSCSGKVRKNILTGASFLNWSDAENEFCPLIVTFSTSPSFVIQPNTKSVIASRSIFVKPASLKLFQRGQHSLPIMRKMMKAH